jgi:hypothetical protein
MLSISKDIVAKIWDAESRVITVDAPGISTKLDVEASTGVLKVL